MGIEQDLLAACADDGLFRPVVEIVLALEFPGDRPRSARCRRPADTCAAADRLDRGILDVVGRVESGSPAPRPITSRPAFFSSRAFCVTAMVAEGFTRERTSARTMTRVSLYRAARNRGVLMS
jgi:hypothetical protein